MTSLEAHSRDRVRTMAVLFLDILGFNDSIEAGSSAAIPVYELLASAFQECDSNGIDSYIAVSDSLIVSSRSVETAFQFALQIFLNFFYNLGEVAQERGRPILLRGGLACNWLTTPFAASLHKEFLKKGGGVNLVGKAYSDAYILSEKVEGLKGARLRISETVHSQLSDISAFPGLSPKYFEVDWATELFRRKTGLAAPILKNVHGCMERLSNDPKLLGSKPEAARDHWTSTLRLLKDSAAKIHPKSSTLEDILSKRDPLL